MVELQSRGFVWSDVGDVQEEYSYDSEAFVIFSNGCDVGCCPVEPDIEKTGMNAIMRTILWKAMSVIGRQPATRIESEKDAEIDAYCFCSSALVQWKRWPQIIYKQLSELRIHATAANIVIKSWNVMPAPGSGSAKSAGCQNKGRSLQEREGAD